MASRARGKFPYEETEDQLMAISDIKSDMEKGKSWID